MAKLIIALPTGRSLEAQTLELLARARIPVERSHARSCKGYIQSDLGLEGVIFCRPAEIPRLVASGKVDMGITGQDTVLESSCSDSLEIIGELPYSRRTAGSTSGVLFVRDEDSIGSLKHIEPGTAIISEYPKETAALLQKHNIDAEVVACSGSAESLVVARAYRVGVALSETGDTLRINKLRRIHWVFHSSTVLIANKTMLDEQHGWHRRQIEFIWDILRGTLEARDEVLLMMNAPVAKAREIANGIVALCSPTIAQLADPLFCSISCVVSADQVNGYIAQLRNDGADGFLVLPISTIMR